MGFSGAKTAEGIEEAVVISQERWWGWNQRRLGGWEVARPWIVLKAEPF